MIEKLQKNQYKPSSKKKSSVSTDFSKGYGENLRS